MSLYPSEKVIEYDYVDEIVILQMFCLTDGKCSAKIWLNESIHVLLKTFPLIERMDFSKYITPVFDSEELLKEHLHNTFGFNKDCWVFRVEY